MLKYIDISEHQGQIDFEKVKGNVDGILIRTGYGRGNIDKCFVRNITECNRLGIPCGAYWFSYAYTADMAKAEAQQLLKAINPYRIELPVAWDWEYDSRDFALKNGVTPGKALVSDMARAFLSLCESAGYYAMNYTNPSLGSQYFDEQIFSRFDLWLAQWPKEWTADSQPQRSCGIWQYGSSAVPGISGPVDSNRAYKDYFSFLGKSVSPDWKSLAAQWAAENGLSVDDPDSTVTKAEVWQMMMEAQQHEERH